MKLRGDIKSDAQVRLHRSFLPALEKMGKTVQMLVQHDQVMFVMMQDDGTEGSLVKLELPTDYIFTNLFLNANKNDTIAFVVTLNLLSKVFATASSIDADNMEMRLATRDLRDDKGEPQKDASGITKKEPILRFQCKGFTHSVTQEVPITKPYSSSQIDDLLGMVSALSLADWYLDMTAHIPKAEALLQSVGRQSNWVTLLATLAGELHLQVRTDHVVQGFEFKPLRVYPEDKVGGAEAQNAGTPDQRFRDAMAGDESKNPRAEVVSKSLSKALAGAAMTNADILLVSCGEKNRPVLHLLCVFTEQATGGIISDYALHVWLPTRDTDDE